jgi:2-octaprenyl-6-methoxyphenol hydroxylase
MSTMETALRIAVIGAGPVGLALALQAARSLPQAQVALYDARPLERDVSADPRALALALGSVQALERLGTWPAEVAQPILEVQVSQLPAQALPGLMAAVPGPMAPWLSRLAGALEQPQVSIRADDVAQPQLGAVLHYGQLVAPLQQAWLAQVQAEPGRLSSRFGQPVRGLKDLDGGVEVDAAVAESFDLAVVAEGGVFAEQARKSLVHDYGQTAWVGRVTLADDSPPGVAYERFTRHGPLALLPLRRLPGEAPQAALVWCVPSADDPLRGLQPAQRLAVLRTLAPPGLGPLQELSPLKSFALGLNAERTLVQRRRVAIGNAAQTLHPVAGQGLNLGLRDAHVLVQALRRHPGAVERALRSVEWARAPDRWSTILTTDFLARSFTWRTPGLASARAVALAALGAAPPLKAALARQMMFGRR